MLQNTLVFIFCDGLKYQTNIKFPLLKLFTLSKQKQGVSYHVIYTHMMLVTNVQH